MVHFTMRSETATTLLLLIALTLTAASRSQATPSTEWASEVTIHRDEWGVPHIKGPTDASVVFGSAYAQCEDHFFQLEDTYIKSLGRYAEIMGESGLDSDMQVALFEIVSRSKSDLATLPKNIRQICEAFSAGYNFYLKHHPETEPRLITRMEPYHVLCFERFMILGRLTGAAHAPQSKLKPLLEEERASLGSNQWAIGPSKTKDGTAMLFINPHQPWYGSGMFTEMHVKSDEGWNFSGAMYPGAPFPTAGFNDYLGWAYTVNAADIADVYRLTFDHPKDPLKYRYGKGYKTATEWKHTIHVKTNEGLDARTYTLRKSHYGPVMAKEDDQHRLAVRIPKFYEGSRMIQALAQAKSKNFEEWYSAASMLFLQTFNTTYADSDGNIFYLYNGTVPIRNRNVDWTQPVDGADPNNEWGGFHPIEELPQILNPISGYVQNCNSTPFTTTDDGNPSMKDFPPYMVEDKYDDKRRAKMSRYLLRNATNVTFEQWQQMAFDTTLYWPMTEFPRYERRYRALKTSHPKLAKQVRPYLEHLLDWDYKSTIHSTQTTLAVEWYEQLYGRGYPVETLKPQFINDIPARFQALITAAGLLEKRYGNWRTPYGDIHRIQRHAPYPATAAVPFNDNLPSLPIAGVRGPLGIAFTIYHTPPTDQPNRNNQYAVTGSSYKAVYEFTKTGARAASYLHYGQSHVPSSPHFFDQAKLLSEKKFKPAYLKWSDVEAHTKRKYRPGQE